MEFQWYPGHMTKAKRQMQEDIKLIDLVIEVIDARCPISSRNPDINGLANGKLRLVLLNKSDLADKAVNQKWISYFKDQGFYCVELDSRDRKNMKGVQATLDEVCAAKFEKDRKRGIKNRPVRAMVVGIPNVGKSTFINSFAGKAVAKTGNKPGVTKGKQWIKLNKSVELLDTPGILWPKFEDNTVGLHLAFIGSINDAIIETRELAMELVDFIKETYPGALAARYEVNEDLVNHEIITEIALKRNFLKKGSEPDFDKAASVLIDEFRNGSLGKISLERP
ncbi:MAG: ribosome biogenesis GTPase YlqF [Pseudobutyrivibrio ruminis]|uniref:ribosome biogenesis GTPase YlqF n=1 Tax=Pseudobutyrivibrio ruminis TaxID=46206 RepID=UPI0026EC3992|nr:ribosome biogenesis GTPase YlqF [Pseudobutyrivibrio ruminis]MBE5914920.1 ribosome biogenesis GTPase YlqF [Pseudobutyrivibrio ruminis]